VLVGLDMQELETASRQNMVQIIILSLTLLFVGLGGWISLLAAQSYRISQDSLNRIQAFTGLLISRLPVGIIATGLDGRILTFNQAAALMTGRGEREVNGRRPADVLPEQVAAFFDITGDNQGIVLDREIVMTTPDGAPLTLQLVSLPVFNQGGGYIGRVLLMNDLTDMKKLEREMHRHDRLVALGKMAAGVAHEVRNPLSSIKGFATMFGRKFARDSMEKEAADLLVVETERLNRSITELLNYARPIPLKKIRSDLAEILRNSLKLVSADAGALGISLSHEIGNLPHIMVDPDRLNQVLLNLYLNGMQTMPDGGELRVTAREGIASTVEIEVRDFGSGISEEILDKILDPYFTTKPDGTGLGLAIAYKIIDEHDGEIRFASEVRKGTTVTVVLPVG